MPANHDNACSTSITAFVFAGGHLLRFLLTGALGCSIFLTLFDATGINQGFVAHCRGCDGFSSQGHQFVSDLVVVEDHQTALFAREGVLKGEWGIATITVSWKAGWSLSTAHGKGKGCHETLVPRAPSH